MARGATFLASLAKPNGAIYTDTLGRSQELPNYNTAGGMMALNATRDPRYRPLVLKAQHFLETFSAVCNHFRPRRHRLSAGCYRQLMRERFQQWQEIAHLTPTV